MSVFHFRRFDVDDGGCGMAVCSDSVLLGAWFAAAHPGATTVADIGAGSGVLALICAQLCPQAQIAAVEIDPAAAAAAKANFEASPWAGRLTLLHQGFEDYASATELIISNPPYFSNGARSAQSQRAVARHQGSLGYTPLLRRAPSLLTQGGHIGLVSPAECAGEIVFEAEMAGLKLRRRLDIKPTMRKPVNRILWDFATADGPIAHDALCLRGADGTPSAEYINLTCDLYTHLR